MRKLHVRFAVILLALLLAAAGSPAAAAAARGDEPVVDSGPEGGNEITRSDIDAGLAFCAEYPVTLILDGEEIVFPEDQTPVVIIKGRTLVPGRALFEAMGGDVDWDEETQMVEIALKETRVTLTIGSDIAWVDGEERTLEVPAMLIDHDGDSYASTMIPARFVAEALGCEVDWLDDERVVLIATPEALNVWSAEDDPEEAEGEKDAEKEKGSEDGVDSFWDPFHYAPLEAMNEGARQQLIAIDPGHGGTDPGTIGNEKKPDQLYEKTVNLKVGLYLKEYLIEAGANLYMIRERDVFITAAERAEMANERGAQLYVSIHTNSAHYDGPTGTETHYYSKVDEDGLDEKQLYGIYSEDVAEAVQRELIKALGTFDRETKESPRLIVLNRTHMPAIIVEGAFMSNAEDFAMIKTDEYAKRYAYAVAKGLIAVMNETYL